ncbi:MAG TPA: rhodanese-like domain-containing protein [Thermoanaerobaculia bacterium]
MLLERFEDRELAHFSYAVADEVAGRMAVVDPRRDVDVYLDFAAARGLAIEAVLETHVHADYASGARELGQRAEATVYASAHDRGEDYEVAFPHRDLADGDTVELGVVRLTALHTPGHTPEHLSFLVHDGARSAEVPMLLLSGDFLFVGSLGRPDLLGEAATRRLAEALHDSVARVLTALPDGLEVHPAHGAGSLCGSGMSGRATSTLGYERIANPYLDPALDRDAFVARILGTVPPFPAYYRRMKRLNAAGPPLLADRPPLPALAPRRFCGRLEAGAVAVDLRDHLAWGGGHVPGSFGLGAGGRLSVWAAWVVPYDRPILLVADDAAEAEEAARRLARVGLDRVEGWLEGGIAAWREAGLPLLETAQRTPRQIHDHLAAGETIHVLDVRGDEEWEAGHVQGARHVMAGELPERLAEVPDDGHPVALVCRSGYRSTVAASVLERAGRTDLINVTGGMSAWERAGLPTTRG